MQCQPPRVQNAAEQNRLAWWKYWCHLCQTETPANRVKKWEAAVRQCQNRVKPRAIMPSRPVAPVAPRPRPAPVVSCGPKETMLKKALEVADSLVETLSKCGVAIGPETSTALYQKLRTKNQALYAPNGPLAQRSNQLYTQLAKRSRELYSPSGPLAERSNQLYAKLAQNSRELYSPSGPLAQRSNQLYAKLKQNSERLYERLAAQPKVTVDQIDPTFRQKYGHLIPSFNVDKVVGNILEQMAAERSAAQEEELLASMDDNMAIPPPPCAPPTGPMSYPEMPAWFGRQH